MKEDEILRKWWERFATEPNRSDEVDPPNFRIIPHTERKKPSSGIPLLQMRRSQARAEEESAERPRKRRGEQQRQFREDLHVETEEIGGEGQRVNEYGGEWGGDKGRRSLKTRIKWICEEKD